MGFVSVGKTVAGVARSSALVLAKRVRVDLIWSSRVVEVLRRASIRA
jgi:hypothetical protein